ncbi:hypothetical protein [uncultured Martelella sp.]|uniref:hypothetical protein n=1 Tax=uncultured Martelella sp. TaxID=392331 RepID=UPI0029C6EAF4|nr:hypothetical protein [uncultured Martelella sp.]
MARQLLKNWRILAADLGLGLPARLILEMLLLFLPATGHKKLGKSVRIRAVRSRHDVCLGRFKSFCIDRDQRSEAFAEAHGRMCKSATTPPSSGRLSGTGEGA